MTRNSSLALCVLTLLSGAPLACSRSDAPPPADAAARARADLEKAASGLQPGGAAQSPAAMSEKDMAEARKAIDGMLEGVRAELARKSAASGNAADPPAPPTP